MCRANGNGIKLGHANHLNTLNKIERAMKSKKNKVCIWWQWLLLEDDMSWAVAEKHTVGFPFYYTPF
jgi:hypothetical protein